MHLILGVLDSVNVCQLPLDCGLVLAWGAAVLAWGITVLGIIPPPEGLSLTRSPVSPLGGTTLSPLGGTTLSPLGGTTIEDLFKTRPWEEEGPVVWEILLKVSLEGIVACFCACTDPLLLSNRNLFDFMTSLPEELIPSVAMALPCE